MLERKHSIRIIVFALLLTMLAWLAPANIGVVKAAEGNAKIPVDGGYLLFDKATGTITGYEGDIKDVTIPEMFEDKKVTSIKKWAFSYYKGLTSVIIPDSVISIEEYAFGYQWDKVNGYSKVMSFNIKIYGCSNDSVAAKYAKDNGFEYVIVNSGGNNNQGVNSNDQNHKSATVPIKTGTTTKPKTVTLKNAASTKKGTLKLTWKHDKKATGYQAMVATDKKFKKNKKTATIKKNKTVTKTFTKLKRKKTYFAKVRAYKQVGKKKVYSAYSKVKKAKVK